MRWPTAAAQPQSRISLLAPCEANRPFPLNLTLATPNEQDLPSCVDVLMHAFYKDAISLAAQTFTPQEMKLLTPPLQKVNGLLEKFARFNLLIQARWRLGRRLRLKPDFARTALGQKTSLMLCAHEQAAPKRVVGVIEISLEPRDGRVPGDVRLPNLPFSPPRAPLVPYISNLAVVTDRRGSGVGRALLHEAECIAVQWGFTEVYLHAALSKSDLIAFYEKLSYEQLPSLDAPQWVLDLSGREATRYLVRRGL